MPRAPASILLLRRVSHSLRRRAPPDERGSERGLGQRQDDLPEDPEDRGAVLAGRPFKIYGCGTVRDVLTRDDGALRTAR
jgi:hypothetical protein